jgi:hypothetical protein
MEKAITMTGPINSGHIEEEIKRALSESAGAATRASLFNLIIFKQAFQEFGIDSSLNYILGKRPARIIFIDSGFPGQSQAVVSARCYPGSTDGAVCFEEVHIQNGDDDIGKDPGFWSSLIIREIPLYIWWLESLMPFPEIFSQIDELADRFLINTGVNESLDEDPFQIVRSLAFQLKKNPSLSFADFSWQRLRPLRKGTAALFEPEAERHYLTEIEAVVLNSGNSSEGLLYFLWLAERLGWQLKNREGNKLLMDKSDGAGIVLNHENKGALESGFLLEFYMRGGNRMELQCSGDNCAFISSPESGKRTFVLQLPSQGEILLREVDSLEADLLYHKALAKSAAI